MWPDNVQLFFECLRNERVVARRGPKNGTSLCKYTTIFIFMKQVLNARFWQHFWHPGFLSFFISSLILLKNVVLHHDVDIVFTWSRGSCWDHRLSCLYQCDCSVHLLLERWILFFCCSHSWECIDNEDLVPMIVLLCMYVL